MKKLFLIIGAPGSGKTTDAELIAKKHENITHYSTGDMLRAEVSSGSDRGNTINKYISAGDIVPIEIVIETIIGAIKNAPTDIVIIDGYPRSEEQMLELDKYLQNEKAVKLINVIEVDVSRDTAFKRVLGRAADAEVVRADDNEEVFINRMKQYTEPLSTIQAFYTEKALLHRIDGEGTIDEIVDSMNTFIKNRLIVTQ